MSKEPLSGEHTNGVRSQANYPAGPTNAGDEIKHAQQTTERWQSDQAALKVIDTQIKIAKDSISSPYLRSMADLY